MDKDFVRIVSVNEIGRKVHVAIRPYMSHIVDKLAIRFFYVNLIFVKKNEMFPGVSITIKGDIP